MQQNYANCKSNEVVQLPVLPSKEFCPVMAIKKLLKIVSKGDKLPVFQILTKHGLTILTAPCVKLLLHPIVGVHTRKCAANIVKKYKCSLVVG